MTKVLLVCGVAVPEKLHGAFEGWPQLGGLEAGSCTHPNA